MLVYQRVSILIVRGSPCNDPTIPSSAACHVSSMGYNLKTTGCCESEHDMQTPGFFLGVFLGHTLGYRGVQDVGHLWPFFCY